MSKQAIPSILVTLLERIQGREALDLEFKAAKGGLPKEIWPTISAFANSQGGWIILGIGEQNGSFTLDGIPNPDRVVKTLYDQLRNEQKISHPICSSGDVSIEPLGDRSVVVIRVPAAPRKARPVHINGNPYQGTYIRLHSGDYHCSKAEVVRMIREAADDTADSTVLPYFGLESLDRNTLAGYRQRFQTSHPGSPWNSYDDQHFLQAIEGYGLDHSTGREGLTIAGLLLSGVPEAIREWRGRHLIDYRLVPDDIEFGTRWEDRVVWEGNLLGAFEAIYPRLTADLRVPFRLEGSTRIEQTPIHVALREALVNLLVHADYSETQASLIKCSPEGYYFRNPGNSRVAEADLRTGDRSDPRNSRLVRMFRLISLAEEAGSGMSKILAAWREQGLQMPSVTSDHERYEFRLELRHVHLISEDDRQWLGSLGGSLNEAAQLALVTTRHEGEIDNVALRSLTGLHPADVTKLLGSLRDRALLQMIGVGRGARYQLGSLAMAGSSAATSAQLPRSPEVKIQPSLPGIEGIVPESPGSSEANSEGLSPNTEDLEANSEGLSPNTEDLEANSEGLSPNTKDLGRGLREISHPARERPYLDSNSRDAILIELCSLSPLSLRELMALMGRSEAYLREVLRTLISRGQIGYLYPGQPRHPRQKYVGVTSSPARSEKP